MPRVLRRAHWPLLILAAFFAGAEAALPLVDPDLLPRGCLAIVSALVVAGSFATRLLANKELR